MVSEVMLLLGSVYFRDFIQSNPISSMYGTYIYLHLVNIFLVNASVNIPSSMDVTTRNFNHISRHKHFCGGLQWDATRHQCSGFDRRRGNVPRAAGRFNGWRSTMRIWRSFVAFGWINGCVMSNLSKCWMNIFQGSCFGNELFLLFGLILCFIKGIYYERFWKWLCFIVADFVSYDCHVIHGCHAF